MGNSLHIRGRGGGGLDKLLMSMVLSPYLFITLLCVPITIKG
jgi:hypothetical protein